MRPSLGSRFNFEVLIAAVLVCALPAQARITQIVIDRRAPLTGQTIAYETIAGRAFGELDPADPHNAIITDVNLAKDADGKVRYVTSFFIVKPVNQSDASGFMWHDVPNRGGRITIVATERNLGDVGLSSGWQGDNAGATAVPAYACLNDPSCFQALPAGTTLANNEWVLVPVAKNTDSSPITGYIQGRIINRSGPNSQPLNVMGNPIPFLPATLDTTQATLHTRAHETIDGKITQVGTILSTDWAFARCTGATSADAWAARTPQNLDHASLPGSLPVHVCLKNGFDPNLLYELVYPVKDPYVTGVGFAAFRDANSFFKNASAAEGNPIAGWINWSVIRGVSQSGNFTRAYLHLGFNQDEANRQVHDGAWPIIAGRRVSLDSRWAQPDGVLELYQMGSEGPQWWVDWPDPVRHLPTTGILARCRASGTCPKVIEHFGGSEVFALKMTTEWVGTAADTDIPLPDNVRRYYVSSSTHGGGNGAMTQNSATNGANCPGNAWGQGVYRANPMPESELVNVLRLAMRNWVMHDTPPPPSVWPRISNGTLVDSTMEAMHFPSGIPAIPPTVFEKGNFVFPVFDYEWGPFFNQTDATGVPTDMPPRIEHVIKMKVPKVDGDGNELGGVPTVLRMAPLGTYLGWNVTSPQTVTTTTVGTVTTTTVTSTPFHQAQVCNYVGGFIPFAVTQAQRTGPDMNVRFHFSANGKGGQWSRQEAVAKDPRPSLEERYTDHQGYVDAVKAAANTIVALGYLLPGDANTLIARAQGSDVLNSTTNTSLAAYGEIAIGVGDADDDSDERPTGTGQLVVNPGDTLQVGYSFSLPGKHPAATITFANAQVIVQADCVGHHNGGHRRTGGPIIVNITNASYSAAQNGSAWLPAAGARDPGSFQGSATVPDLCHGNALRIGEDATFTAIVGSQ